MRRDRKPRPRGVPKQPSQLKVATLYQSQIYGGHLEYQHKFFLFLYSVVAGEIGQAISITFIISI